MTQQLTIAPKKILAVIIELLLLLLVSWLLANIYVVIAKLETQNYSKTNTLIDAKYLHYPIPMDYQLQGQTTSPSNEQQYFSKCTSSSCSTTAITTFFWGGGAIVLFLSRPIIRFGDFISDIIADLFKRRKKAGRDNKDKGS